MWSAKMFAAVLKKFVDLIREDNGASHFSLFISPFSPFQPYLLVPLCITQRIFSSLQQAQQNLIVQFGKMMLLAAVKLNLRYQADAVIEGESGTESLMNFNSATG